MNAEEWSARVRAATNRFLERRAVVERRIADSSSTGYSADRTVKATVDGARRLEAVAIRPSSLREHTNDSLAEAVIQAHRAAFVQSGRDQLAVMRDEFRTGAST